MNTTSTNSPNVFSEAQGKGKKKTGLELFFEFFSTRTTTVYDFEKCTGISRANGCQYKRKLERAGKLQIVRLGVCPVSGANGVQYVTTNPKKFRPVTQLRVPFGAERGGV